MSNITLRTGCHSSGRPYECFETLDVLRDGEMIGAIQCEGPCWGMTASLGHRHGPWIAFVGPNGDAARNLPGRYDNKVDAVEAVASHG